MIRRGAAGTTARKNEDARSGRGRAFTVTLTRSFETLVCRLFRDAVEFCSGLVDLVVCVRHHVGGGHRCALAYERFVGLVAEDLT